MKKMLIVDDHAGARSWLGQTLTALFPSAELQTAVDFAGGLQALQQTTLPELALFDLGLPDGHGVDLVKRYKQIKPDGLAVVATLFDDDGHLFDALRAGADGYLLKDDDKATQTLLLQGIQAGQPPLSPSIARRVLAFFSGLHAPAAAAKIPEAKVEKSESEVELTPREADTLKLIAKGYNVPQVAEFLSLSKHTVAGYLRDVYRKLAINSRAEATLAAAQRGLIA
jgi:DNA-binding NarL/FixJ family response regulator